jgi:hypothetical protein
MKNGGVGGWLDSRGQGGECGEVDEENERRHILSPSLYTARYTGRAHTRRTAGGCRGLARGAAGAGVCIGAAHGTKTGGGTTVQSPPRRIQGSVRWGQVEATRGVAVSGVRARATLSARPDGGWRPSVIHLPHFTNAKLEILE